MEVKEWCIILIINTKGLLFCEMTRYQHQVEVELRKCYEIGYCIAILFTVPEWDYLNPERVKGVIETVGCRDGSDPYS